MLIFNEILPSLEESVRANAILIEPAARSFIQLGRDPIMRLQFVKALIYEQLWIRKAIPPPDPALKFDWSVRDRLIGKRFRQQYLIDGPGFRRRL